MFEQSYSLRIRISAYSAIVAIDLVLLYLLIYYANSIYQGWNLILFLFLVAVFFSLPFVVCLIPGYLLANLFCRLYGKRIRYLGIGLTTGFYFALLFLPWIYLIDAPTDYFCSLFFLGDTQFAESYTPSGYKDVQIGMTRDEVLSLLGPPFKDRSLDWSWSYAYSPGGTHHWQRIIVFGNDGLVKEKLSGYYVD